MPHQKARSSLGLKKMHQKSGRTQEQAAPLTKIFLNQLLDSCDNSIVGIRN